MARQQEELEEGEIQEPPAKDRPLILGLAATNAPQPVSSTPRLRTCMAAPEAPVPVSDQLVVYDKSKEAPAAPQGRPRRDQVKKLRGMSTSPDAPSKKPRRAAVSQKRLNALKSKCAEMEKHALSAEARALEAETRALKAEKMLSPGVQLTPTPLAQLRGRLLGDEIEEETRKKECPVCYRRFTSEGWYRVGSCGHEYHLQCLILHALCESTCVACSAKFPDELYLTLGQEKPPSS